MYRFFIVIAIIILSITHFTFAQLLNGNWHAAIQLNDTLELPFTFTSANNKIIIHNGDEEISVDEIKINGDSIIIQMPVFDSEFRCKLSEGKLTGRFNNHARKKENTFDFHATIGLSYRFSDKPERTNVNLTGRYHIVFDGEDEIAKDAVGIFKQEGNRVTGTFLTITGDYRYLEGELNGKRLLLSAFDGSHLFLFTAEVKGDSLINGQFFSGKHWYDTWRGIKDENAKLPDPESLITFSANEKFNFSFPDENGKIISLDDEQFKNKPVLIQLMGTWCPNCLDETKFLSEWFNKEYPGVEIIAVDFERITDTATVNRNIKRLKKQFNIHYPVLFAGSNDKSLAAKNLKLNRVIAFPTLIFLDSQKNIKRIHSGFNGPATGDEFTLFKKWFLKSVEEL